jgi:hypothetical protein
LEKISNMCLPYEISERTLGKARGYLAWLFFNMRRCEDDQGKESRMHIEIERKTDCFADNCPAQGKVTGLPGWKLYVGKKPETMLDPEALAELQEHVGPGEYAVLVPEEL